MLDEHVMQEYYELLDTQLEYDELIPVFVYGTLKYGFSNHDVLAAYVEAIDAFGDDVVYSQCATVNKYKLGHITIPMIIHTGSYPVMVPQDNGVVIGELYYVTQDGLDTLDYFEGVNRGLFTRELIDVDVEGRTVKAYAYVYAKEISEGSIPNEARNKVVAVPNYDSDTTVYSWEHVQQLKGAYV